VNFWGWVLVAYATASVSWFTYLIFFRRDLVKAEGVTPVICMTGLILWLTWLISMVELPGSGIVYW
jgi:hypothetical protein